VPDETLVMNAGWRRRVAELIETYPRLLGVSVHNKLQAEGFGGGYSTVTRELRGLRGPRFKAAVNVSVPIHSDPGEEAQFDFCDLSEWAARWGWGRLWCFGMILCWSRWRLWWFTTSEDRQHTFEGIIRFFEAAGGVPAACRTDRMGALGRSQRRRFVLHPPTVGFAGHHATTLTSCRAGDAKRKGKVERPFRQLQETFLPEVELDGIPADLADLNRRVERWLTERVHALPSRSTGEAPTARLAVERAFLSPLPRERFDSDYVESRRVHNIVPFITVDGARYSTPAETLGQLVEIRRRVDADEFTVSWAGRRVVTHQLGARGTTVWHPEHHAAAQAVALGRHRNDDRHLRLVASATEHVPARLDLGDGDSTSTSPTSTPATASTGSSRDRRLLRADQG
jgi:transposase